MVIIVVGRRREEGINGDKENGWYEWSVGVCQWEVVVLCSYCITSVCHTCFLAISIRAYAF